MHDMSTSLVPPSPVYLPALTKVFLQEEIRWLTFQACAVVLVHALVSYYIPWLAVGRLVKMLRGSSSSRSRQVRCPYGRINCFCGRENFLPVRRGASVFFLFLLSYRTATAFSCDVVLNCFFSVPLSNSFLGFLCISPTCWQLFLA